MKRKILLISYSFFPVNTPRSIRTTELAKEFAKQGHVVTVITPKDDNIHSKFEKKYKVIIKPLTKINFKSKKEISYNKPYLLPIKKIIYSILDFFFHYPFIKWMYFTLKALKDEKGYDLLISVAAPHPIHWGISFIHSKDNRIAKTWVADCGDPFMGLKRGIFYRPFYFKYIEKRWCKIVDFISIPIDSATKAYYPEFHRKIITIPQGMSFPEIKKVTKKNLVPKIIYSGSISPYKHYYIPFFNYLKGLKINFVLILYSKNRSLIEKNINGIEDKVEIRDYVPRERLIKSLSSADFLVHFPYKNDKQKSLKLVDYHYSETPILSYKGSLDNKSLEKFLKGNYKNKLLKENIENYKIENVASKFIDLVKNKNILNE